MTQPSAVALWKTRAKAAEANARREFEYAQALMTVLRDARATARRAEAEVLALQAEKAEIEVMARAERLRAIGLEARIEELTAERDSLLGLLTAARQVLAPIAADVEARAMPGLFSRRPAGPQPWRNEARVLLPAIDAVLASSAREGP